MIKRFLKTARTRLSTGFKAACLAGRFEEGQVFFLTSSPRSGSTILGYALGEIEKSCMLFEPLQLDEVPEARTAGFSWRSHVAPLDNWPEGKAFLTRVFAGRVINGWTGREMSAAEAVRARSLIVKSVRANRLLPWICENFRIPPPVFLVRHPCAVVASQLNYGWRGARRPEIPSFIDNYPVFRSTVSGTRDDVENLAALWALDQLPPLLQDKPHPWTLLSYEELILRPEPTFTRIFQNWNLDVDAGKAASRLNRPSSVVGQSGISGIDGWKRQLTADQVARILRTVRAFGLRFYTEDDEADYHLLHSEKLAGQIREAGTGQTSGPSE
jgi:hypothetical protein